MRYEAVIARDFPGYMKVEIDVKDDQDAVRYLKEKFNSGELTEGGPVFDPQWEMGHADRIVSVTRSDGMVILEDWHGESPATGEEPESRVRCVACELRSAAVADIWYDAKDYGDTAAEKRIEAVQAALCEAADFLERQNELLRQMQGLLAIAVVPGGVGPHDFVRPGGWRERATKLLGQASMLTQACQTAGQEAAKEQEVNHVV